MSTQFYHVTLEALSGKQVEFTLRVTDASSAPMATPPEHPSFALRVLQEAGAKWGPKVFEDDIFNDAWAREHAEELITSVKVVDRHRFDEVADESAYNEKLNGLMEESDGDAWVLDDAVARARYVVTVADPQWLQTLEVGKAWESCAYPA